MSVASADLPDTPQPEPWSQLIGDSGLWVSYLGLDLRYTQVLNPPPPLQAADLLRCTDEELFGTAGALLTGVARDVLGGAPPVRLLVELGGRAGPGQFMVWIGPRRDAAGELRGLLRIALAEPGAAPGEQAAAQRLAASQQELRRSQELLGAIFEALDDGLLLLDRGGQVLAANQRLADLAGVEREQLLGRGVAELSQAHPAIWPWGAIEAALADGVARSERGSGARAGGDTWVADLRVLPLPPAGGPAEQILVRVADVTAQSQVEARLEERERLVANQRLAASVAHEVSSPLQSIESCLHLVRRSQDEEVRLRYIELAREEIRRVGFIMRQLLDISRPAQSQLAEVQVNELVERVLLLTEGNLARQRIAVSRELQQPLPRVRGRPDELTQVLLNLIFNAQQAMPQGGSLALRTLRAAGDDAAVLVELVDSGPGVPAELREQIFEPFFTTRPDGNGLGLSICRRIARGYGGDVLVLDGEPGGARFQLRLPAI